MKNIKKNESKKNNKKTLIIILIIILLIILACATYFMIINMNKNNQGQNNEELVQISTTLLEPRQYNNISFHDMNFYNIGQDTEEFQFKLQNIGQEATQDQWVELIFVDAFSYEITSVPLKIPALQPGESTNASVSSNSDLKKAVKFSIFETEAPSEFSPEDLM